MPATPRTCMAFLAALFLLSSAPAAAQDCSASAAHDRCLIGTWKMTVNGAEEWMRQNIHMAHPTSVAATDNTITLKADGTFSTGASQATAHVAANEGRTEASGTMNAKARGQWSTRDGSLFLCSEVVRSNGTIHVHDSNGADRTIPMPQLVPQVSHQAYHCSGDTFTTTQPMPHGTTMSSTYVKIH